MSSANVYIIATEKMRSSVLSRGWLSDELEPPAVIPYESSNGINDEDDAK